MNLDEVRQSIVAALAAGPIALVLGRDVAGDSGEIVSLRLSKDAAQSFRELGEAAVDQLESQVAVEYTSMAELEAGEVFLLVDQDSLEELAELRQAALEATAHKPIGPAELDARIGYYVVAAGDGANQVAFVRRADPRLKARAGRVFAIAKERLAAVEGPVFTFAPNFDLVLGVDWAVVLNQTSFERLARETGIVARHVDSWVKGISDYLPMGEASRRLLSETAQKDSRTWRRLRDIQRRGHLAGVELQQVAQYATRVGLRADDFIKDDELFFEPTQRFNFLLLLSEDLFTGGLTGEVFEAQRKSSLG